jgi:hypothetical protein
VLLSDVPVEEISGLYDAEEGDDAELEAALAAPAISAAEEAAIAGLLGAELPALQLSVADTDAADMAGDAEEEAELDEAMVSEYIKSLQVRRRRAGLGWAAGCRVGSLQSAVCPGQLQDGWCCRCWCCRRSCRCGCCCTVGCGAAATAGRGCAGAGSCRPHPAPLRRPAVAHDASAASSPLRRLSLPRPAVPT